MNLRIWGCLINAIGIVLRFMVPHSIRIWPAYTLLLTLGWTIYAPSQLLVLYSRLHFVNYNEKLHRILLFLILSTLVAFILPTWIMVWPAFDPDPQLSSAWSPRDAIVERYTQIGRMDHIVIVCFALTSCLTGFTLIEACISGIYIRSLIELLPKCQYEVNICQRRVIRDLICVNVIGLTLDVVNVVFLYLNQSGLSHPVQSFSYALKLKLEFVVLNQLVAVATRGRGRLTWDARRYRPGCGRSSRLFSIFKRQERPRGPPNSREPRGHASESKDDPFHYERAAMDRLNESSPTVQVYELGVSPALAGITPVPPAVLDSNLRTHSDLASVTSGSRSVWFCMGSPYETFGTQGDRPEDLENHLRLRPEDDVIDLSYWHGRSNDVRL